MHISKIIEYMLICMGIAQGITNTRINRYEMLRAHLESLAPSIEDNVKLSINSENIDNKGTVMKQRYEEARKRLSRYQDQIVE